MTATDDGYGRVRHDSAAGIAIWTEYRPGHGYYWRNDTGGPWIGPFDNRLLATKAKQPSKAVRSGNKETNHA